ncbi:MAG: type II secretion system F family protein [Candidatus Omnitrophica bacterium]|nr:type II secretion system F family protein [Candidatus Omnitrophota bacterium]
MNVFSYVVKDKEGKILKGAVEADSKEKLVENFHKEGYVIFSIAESHRKGTNKIHGRIKTDELVVFSRQFTTLIESGIPVVEAMSILRDQVTNAFFKNVLWAILKDIKEGASLSGAFIKHPKVFPEIYTSMVEAAEVSGNLPEILERVSVYLEKSSALKKKIISAMYYPIIIVLIAIGITSFMMFKIVPTFKGIFDMLGGKLPLPTQILINLSEFLKNYIILMIIVVILAAILFRKYTSSYKGSRKYHKFLMKLPIIGGLVNKIAIARFARTFATLIRSGVPVIKCLEIVAKTSGNKIIEDAVMESRKSIQEGQPISVPLEKSTIFPTMVTKMIAVGEKSGRLEAMLTKIAQFYEEQTDAMVAGLSSLIEPLIIVFLGVVVGGIVVSLFLPIIKITQYIT